MRSILVFHIFRSFHAGNTSCVDGKAHGVSGKEEDVAVIVDVAGIRSGCIESRDRFKITVTALAVFVDTDTAYRTVSARTDRCRIVWAFLRGRRYFFLLKNSSSYPSQ